jgi:DNA-binding IclR family transcriptional regulator
MPQPRALPQAAAEAAARAAAVKDNPRAMREVDRSLYSVAVVRRVTDLLDALTRRAPTTLAELADQVGCTRTAAFRLLRTLEASGHAMQDGRRGKWRLGPRLVSAGAAAIAQRSQEWTSLPVMRALAGELGENLYLHRRDGLDALTLTVAVAPVQPPVRVYLGVGDRSGLHAAHGRVLLAWASERVQQQLVRQRLQRYAPRTPTDATAVLADAARVRQRGWLLTTDELAEGELTLCVPVRDGAGVALALALTSPRLRLTQPQARAALPALLACAEQLSLLLGAAAPGERGG